MPPELLQCSGQLAPHPAPLTSALNVQPGTLVPREFTPALQQRGSEFLACSHPGCSACTVTCPGNCYKHCGRAQGWSCSRNGKTWFCPAHTTPEYGMEPHMWQHVHCIHQHLQPGGRGVAGDGMSELDALPPSDRRKVAISSSKGAPPPVVHWCSTRLRVSSRMRLGMRSRNSGVPLTLRGCRAGSSLGDRGSRGAVRHNPSDRNFTLPYTLFSQLPFVCISV